MCNKNFAESYFYIKSKTVTYKKLKDFICNLVDY